MGDYERTTPQSQILRLALIFFIPFCHIADLLFYRLLQTGGFNHLNIRTVFENIHDQLGGVVVGDAELVFVIYPLALLFGVPLLFFDVTGALLVEVQNGDFVGFAGEDAKGTLQMFFELLLGYLYGGFCCEVNLLNIV